MAKDWKKSKTEQPKQDMTLEEARAYRASLYKEPVVILSAQEKREAFRIFWAQEKSKYGRSKDIEEIIWMHLTSVKMDAPEKFSEGLTNFGLKKLGN